MNLVCKSVFCGLHIPAIADAWQYIERLQERRVPAHVLSRRRGLFFLFSMALSMVLRAVFLTIERV